MARFVAAIALAWSAWAVTAQAAGITLPAGPGANLVYARCQTCHDLQYVVDAKGLLPAQWKSTLAGMKDYGLTLSDADQATILTYLTTYLGPNPPPAAASSTGASGERATPASGASANGRHVFEENCSACHGIDGKGQPGMYPALAGNPDLAKDAGLPGRVVLFGLTGPIEVGGASYSSTMPPFGHLGDSEIAAVVNYVRSAWGNAANGRAAPIDAKAIAVLRAQALSSADVHAYRERLVK